MPPTLRPEEIQRKKTPRCGNAGKVTEPFKSNSFLSFQRNPSLESVLGFVLPINTQYTIIIIFCIPVLFCLAFCASLRCWGRLSQASLRRSTSATLVSNLSLSIHLKLCCCGTDKCGWGSGGWLWKYHKQTPGTRQLTGNTLCLLPGALIYKILRLMGFQRETRYALNMDSMSGVHAYVPVLHVDPFKRVLGFWAR